MTIRAFNHHVTLSLAVRYSQPKVNKFAAPFAPDVAVCLGVVCACSAVLACVLSLVNGGAL